MEPGQFEGVVGRTLDESTAWWPPLPSAPAGAPNVVMVLLDDVGYAQFGCYGSDIATPTFDRLAGRGLRYSNFHTTALCSPTRACLLTGRNHHASGMARIVEFSSGFPGYDATMPPANGFLSEMLVRNGYATFAVGKWHLAPAPEMAPGATRRAVAARPRVRALLRLPRRRDRPVPPRPRPRQPPGRPAAHARGGLPPHRGPGRPGDRLRQGPAGVLARPAVLPLLRARRLPRPAPGARGPTATATAAASTTAGTAGGRRSSPASRRAGLLPPGTALSERPAWIPRVGRPRRRRAPALRPHDGGVRRVPRAHRRPGRPGRRRSSSSSASSTTRSCWS